ncbi:MAG: cysteine desulfurase family protein [Pseudomonadota bacterium]
MRIKNAIYMDYQSTTPLDPVAKAAMLPFMEDKFGNPHSSSHRFGWEAEAAVDVARGQVASVLDVDPAHLFFTSGATESNNMAIKGLALGHLQRPGTIITLASEHSCVLESVRAAQTFGHVPEIVPIQPNGLVDLGALEAALTTDVFLVSVMAVNNEIGTIQPLEKIASLLKPRGILLHCDAAQAYGKVPVDTLAQHCDLISLSAHKIYGPKGIGALYVSAEAQRHMSPHMSGGGQEGHLRSGTLAPALCAGFGAAAQIAAEKLEGEQTRAQRHFEMLLAGLDAMPGDYVLNGCADTRLKSNVNVSFHGTDSARLMANVRRLAVSSGAACASAKEGPSYVLEALGVPPALAEASLRIGTGRFTDDSQVSDALGYIEDALAKSRKRSWSQ